MHTTLYSATLFQTLRVHNILEVRALIYLYRLHAKLEENDEAAKLYTRFVATVATSEVCVCVCVHS